MQLNELKSSKGSLKSRKRLGRGIGSGKGKTCGRGHKGQKSRSGVSINGFEGGQTPLYQRLPRRGFNNKNFRKVYAPLNLQDIQRLVDAKKIKEGDEISAKTLLEKGIVKNPKDGIKILGVGELNVKLSFKISKVSDSAKQKLEKAGCDVKIIEVSSAKEDKKKASQIKAAAGKAKPKDKKEKAPRGKKKAKTSGKKATASKVGAAKVKKSDKEASAETKKEEK